MKRGGPLKRKTRMNPGKPLSGGGMLKRYAKLLTNGIGLKKSRMKPKKAKAATAQEKRRMGRVKECGCVVCWLFAYKATAAAAAVAYSSGSIYMPYFTRETVEAHHLKDGNRRRGHRFTIGLCEWHHQGQNGSDAPLSVTTSQRGPSLAIDANAFHDLFGTDDELLALQDALLLRVYGEI